MIVICMYILISGSGTKSALRTDISVLQIPHLPIRGTVLFDAKCQVSGGWLHLKTLACITLVCTKKGMFFFVVLVDKKKVKCREGNVTLDSDNPGPPDLH